MTKAFVKFIAPLMLALLLPFTSLAQQNLFQTVIKVNDQAITQFEINQRIILLGLLRAPGDPRAALPNKLSVISSPPALHGGTLSARNSAPAHKSAKPKSTAHLRYHRTKAQHVFLCPRLFYL